MCGLPQRKGSWTVIRLPQQHPFRFVDEVTRLTELLLESRFEPSACSLWYRGTDTVPAEVIIEGAAQSTVLFFERLVEPLTPEDIPVLGQISVTTSRQAGWHESITFQIRPVRVLSNIGLFAMTAVGSEGPIAEGTIGVAKVRTPAPETIGGNAYG